MSRRGSAMVLVCRRGCVLSRLSRATCRPAPLLESIQSPLCGLNEGHRSGAASDRIKRFADGFAEQLVRHLAAGHAVHLASHEPGFVRRQKDEDRCNFHWLRRSLERRLPAEATHWSGGRVAGMSGVQTGPGATALTRIPCSIASFDSAFVKLTIAALVGAYASNFRAWGVCLTGGRVDDAAAWFHARH